MEAQKKTLEFNEEKYLYLPKFDNTPNIKALIEKRAMLIDKNRNLKETLY